MSFCKIHRTLLGLAFALKTLTFIISLITRKYKKLKSYQTCVSIHIYIWGLSNRYQKVNSKFCELHHRFCKLNSHPKLNHEFHKLYSRRKPNSLFCRLDSRWKLNFQSCKQLYSPKRSISRDATFDDSPE